MPLIVPVVEGPGDAAALPILIRKIITRLNQSHIGVATAKNAHGCGNLERVGGLERFVEYAFRTPDCAGVLIVMDTDKRMKCPKIVASELATRIRGYGARKPVAVVFAKNEYEAWLIASIESIAGKPLKGSVGIAAGTVAPPNCEEVSSPKAWIEQRFTSAQAYKETMHQPAMSSYLDLNIASPRSRSLRRLIHAVEELTQAIQIGAVSVTP